MAARRARRGEVRLLDFREPVGREQAGHRPAVIVSDDGPSGLVIVVPITSRRRDLPSHIELDDAASGLDEVSYAKCEDVKSVSERRLISRVGSVPIDALADIERILRYLLSL